MRVLGVEISGSDTRLVILDGTAEDFNIAFPSPSKLRLPAAGPEADQLIAFKKQMHEVLKSNQAECLGIIRADFGTSPIRAKVECMIQVASSEASIPCTLVAPQTVAAAEKRKVNAVAGPGLDLAIQGISPGYLRKAAYCAWSVLNAKQ
jgi:hypothetical protein